MDLDLSLFRPVYSPKVRTKHSIDIFHINAVFDKDFLEVLAQLHSPNHAPQGAGQLGRPFGLIQVKKNVNMLKN